MDVEGTQMRLDGRSKSGIENTQDEGTGRKERPETLEASMTDSGSRKEPVRERLIFRVSLRFGPDLIWDWQPTGFQCPVSRSG